MVQCFKTGHTDLIKGFRNTGLAPIFYAYCVDYDTACIYIAAFRDQGTFNYLFCSWTRSKGFCQTWNRIAMTASASAASVMVSAFQCENLNSSEFFVPHVFAVKGCCPFESESIQRYTGFQSLLEFRISSTFLHHVFF